MHVLLLNDSSKTELTFVIDFFRCYTMLVTVVFSLQSSAVRGHTGLTVHRSVVTAGMTGVTGLTAHAQVWQIEIC